MSVEPSIEQQIAASRCNLRDLEKEQLRQAVKDLMRELGRNNALVLELKRKGIGND